MPKHYLRLATVMTFDPTAIAVAGSTDTAAPSHLRLATLMKDVSSAIAAAGGVQAGDDVPTSQSAATCQSAFGVLAHITSTTPSASRICSSGRCIKKRQQQQQEKGISLGEVQVS